MLRSLKKVQIQFVNGTKNIKCYSNAAAAPQSAVVKTENNESNRGRKMTGWQIHSYGDLSELQYSEKLRIPMIRKPTEVLVKVNSSSVNPIDVAMIGDLQY